MKLNEFKNIDIKSEYQIFGPIKTVTDTFNYDSDYKNFNIGVDIFLNGYWQSEKYFTEFEKIIRKELEIDFKLDIPYIDTNSVSLHVRRSDYIDSNGYHPVQSISYYKNAIDYLSDYDHLFIFSDDIQWCKENLKFKNMIFMENFSDIQDMYVMSQCKNNIIANSSFSWWGAWLNNNPKKVVISPSKWFGDHVNINQSDIIPSKWIKI
jgi:hypothetical protein